MIFEGMFCSGISSGVYRVFCPCVCLLVDCSEVFVHASLFRDTCSSDVLEKCMFW